MSQNTNPYQKTDTDNRKSRPVAVVTTDRSLWAQRSKFRWIFWLAVLLSAAVLFASCKNGSSSDTQLHASDTAGLAAFNAQKAADSAAALQNEEGTNPQGQKGADLNQSHGSQQSYAGNDGSEESGAIKSVNDANSGSADDNSAGATAAGTSDMANTGENTATTTTKKKRFSNAAKGALIGAGSGAVVGAIVSKKNRGLGAVIGAAVGGGAGYGIGKHKDNKEAQEGQ